MTKESKWMLATAAAVMLTVAVSLAAGPPSTGGSMNLTDVSVSASGQGAMEVTLRVDGEARYESFVIDGPDRLVVEQLITKPYSGHDDSVDIGEVIDQFWIEWDKFHSKKGETYSRKYIWNSQLLHQDGKSHEWHKSFSVPFTKVHLIVVCLMSILIPMF